MLAAALEHIVKGIVDHPEDVRINESTSPRGGLLEVRGRTAKALRTLVSALADGRRVRVDVADD